MDRFRRFIAHSNISFKQHQFDGVQWCVNNETRDDPLVRSIRGGFIADEMGLGKTIMAIGTCVANLLPRTLIVLPSVLINQWYNEILRTTGHKSLIFHGPDQKKISMLELESAPFVITSYGIISNLKRTIALSVAKGAGERLESVDDSQRILKKNIDDELSFVCPLHNIVWNRVIFDEAHHLRNKNRQFYGARNLKTDIRWLITGTPIQNKRADFYNLCRVIGRPASFFTDYDNFDALSDNFILRRTKASANVVLPTLVVDNEIVPWKSESERVLSEDIHLSLKAAQQADKLKLFIRARQICILPFMIREKLQQMNNDFIVRGDHSGTVAQCSSKMDSVIDTLLSRKGNGNGKLVFCHFKEEIDTIIARLSANGLTNVSSFDGRTRQSQRHIKLAQKFEVLVLQIQTGCEGLNLQNDYCEVYFVSPHWNPSIEDQAVARCHRIGQSKPVQVFKFVMDSFDCVVSDIPNLTLDQYVAMTQQSKRNISNTILPIPAITQ